MHGPHQVAQKSTSTTLPWYFDQSKAPPPSTFPSIFISWPTRLSRRTTPSSTLANSASLAFLLAAKTLANLVYVLVANSLSPLISASMPAVYARVRSAGCGGASSRNLTASSIGFFTSPRPAIIALRRSICNMNPRTSPGELFVPALLQFGDKVGKLLGLVQHVHLRLHGELHLLIVRLGRENLFGGLQNGLPQLLQRVRDRAAAAPR